MRVDLRALYLPEKFPCVHAHPHVWSPWEFQRVVGQRLDGARLLLLSRCPFLILLLDLDWRNKEVCSHKSKIQNPKFFGTAVECVSSALGTRRPDGREQG